MMNATIICMYEHHTCPSLDPAFLDAEDENGSAFDHGPPLGIIEATGYAGDNALSCCMN